MLNSYQLMTLQYGLFMDVTGDVSDAGTPLQVWSRNSPPSPNQLWIFEWPDMGVAPDRGFFYIKSSLDPENLNVDITGGAPKAGTPLQVWTPNPPGDDRNQLWRFVPAWPGAPLSAGYIQSLLDPNLVIDVTGGSRATRGTRLEVWTKNSPASANQLWWLLPAPGNTYDPRLGGLGAAGRGFTIFAEGFQAGSFVWANYQFYIPGEPSNLEQGSFIATTDFAGNFYNNSPITILDERPGTLELNIVISFPPFPNNPVEAQWDGSTFNVA